MTETPTVEPPAAKARGAYLPSLPKGWRYDVTLYGPDEASNINIVPSGGGSDQADAHLVQIHSPGEKRRTMNADSLADAAKAAAGAAKSLAKIGEKERELAAERAALLETLGTDSLVDVEALAKYDKSAGLPSGKTVVRNDTGEREPVDLAEA